MAPVSMVKQGKTLEEVIKSYEDDLAFLNSKLGPDLYNCVLDAAKREPIVINMTASNQSDEVQDKAEEQKGNTEATKDQQIGKEAKQQVDPKSKESEDKTREKAPKLSKDSQEKKHEKETHTDKDTSTVEASTSDTGVECHEPTGELHQPLRAAALLAEQGNTLQDIMEEYERDLDIYNVSLGPSLAKAVLDAG